MSINMSNSVFIKCDCDTEAIEIVKDDDLIFLNLWIMTWFSHNIWWEIVQRVKMAWDILRKGNYQYQEIILDKSKAVELKELLEDMIEEE